MKKEAKVAIAFAFGFLFVGGGVFTGLIAFGVVDNPFEKQSIITDDDVNDGDDSSSDTINWIAFNFTDEGTTKVVEEDWSLYIYDKDLDGLTDEQIDKLDWDDLSLDEDDTSYESGDHVLVAEYVNHAVAFKASHDDYGTYYIRSFSIGMNEVNVVNKSTDMYGSAVSEDLSEQTLTNCTSTDWTIFLRAADATGDDDAVVGFDSYKLDLPEGNFIYNYTIVRIDFNCTPQYNFADIDGAYDEIILSSGTTNSTYFLIDENVYNDETLTLDLTFNEDLLGSTYNCSGGAVLWGNLDTSTTVYDTIS